MRINRRSEMGVSLRLNCVHRLCRIPNCRRICRRGATARLVSLRLSIRRYRCKCVHFKSLCSILTPILTNASTDTFLPWAEIIFVPKHHRLLTKSRSNPISKSSSETQSHLVLQISSIVCGRAILCIKGGTSSSPSSLP
jgi:hypothetical protein